MIYSNSFWKNLALRCTADYNSARKSGTTEIPGRSFIRSWIYANYGIPKVPGYFYRIFQGGDFLKDDAGKSISESFMHKIDRKRTELDNPIADIRKKQNASDSAPDVPYTIGRESNAAEIKGEMDKIFSTFPDGFTKPITTIKTDADKIENTLLPNYIWINGKKLEQLPDGHMLITTKTILTNLWNTTKKGATENPYIYKDENNKKKTEFSFMSPLELSLLFLKEGTPDPVCIYDRSLILKDLSHKVLYDSEALSKYYKMMYRICSPEFSKYIKECGNAYITFYEKYKFDFAKAKSIGVIMLKDIRQYFFTFWVNEKLLGPVYEDKSTNEKAFSAFMKGCPDYQEYREKLLGTKPQEVSESFIHKIGQKKEEIASDNPIGVIRKRQKRMDAEFSVPYTVPRESNIKEVSSVLQKIIDSFPANLHRPELRISGYDPSYIKIGLNVPVPSENDGGKIIMRTDSIISNVDPEDDGLSNFRKRDYYFKDENNNQQVEFYFGGEDYCLGLNISEISTDKDSGAETTDKLCTVELLPNIVNRPLYNVKALTKFYLMLYKVSSREFSDFMENLCSAFESFKPYAINFQTSQTHLMNYDVNPGQEPSDSDIQEKIQKSNIYDCKKCFFRYWIMKYMNIKDSNADEIDRKFREFMEGSRIYGNIRDRILGTSISESFMHKIEQRKAERDNPIDSLRQRQAAFDAMPDVPYTVGRHSDGNEIVNVLNKIVDSFPDGFIKPEISKNNFDDIWITYKLKDKKALDDFLTIECKTNLGNERPVQGGTPHTQEYIDRNIYYENEFHRRAIEYTFGVNPCYLSINCSEIPHQEGVPLISLYSNYLLPEIKGEPIWQENILDKFYHMLYKVCDPKFIDFTLNCDDAFQIFKKDHGSALESNDEYIDLGSQKEMKSHFFTFWTNMKLFGRQLNGTKNDSVFSDFMENCSDYGEYREELLK